MEDYKTGDNYEAGLWSRRNIEAFVRDGNSINKRPAPCEILCEAKAFEIEIRQLKAENARLQSVIDEANAQEPDAVEGNNGSVMAKHEFSDIDAFLRSCRNNTPLYKRPIPAQKSIDRDTIINVLLSIGNMSEGIIADAIIGTIGAQQSPDYAAIRKWYVNLTNSDNVQDGINVNGKHCTDAMLDDLDRILEQQSPAVAVPDSDGLLPLSPHDHPDCQAMVWTNSEIKAIKEYAVRCIAVQSPRITEQDAREICESFQFWSDYHFIEGMFGNWLAEEGEELLNKLNAKPESVGG